MDIGLIVNADDFGYFDGVSEGILEAITAGTVTATGVMANGLAFERWVGPLSAQTEVDVGVHLNATLGIPLTPCNGSPLIRSLGCLPNKGRLAVELLTGRLPIDTVAEEWRAQINKCIAAGLQIRFLNSHEHIHMHPLLYPVTCKLAKEFGIRFVRYTQPEFTVSCGPAAVVRSLVLAVLSCVQSPLPQTAELLGLAASGHFNITYLRTVLPRLKIGRAYELMCHPGRDDLVAVKNSALRHYHNWTSELECLLGREFRATLDGYSVRLTRFRDLRIAN